MSIKMTITTEKMSSSSATFKWSASPSIIDSVYFKLKRKGADIGKVVFAHKDKVELNNLIPGSNYLVNVTGITNDEKRVLVDKFSFDIPEQPLDMFLLDSSD